MCDKDTGLMRQLPLYHRSFCPGEVCDISGRIAQRLKKSEQCTALLGGDIYGLSCRESAIVDFVIDRFVQRGNAAVVKDALDSVSTSTSNPSSIHESIPPCNGRTRLAPFAISCSRLLVNRNAGKSAILLFADFSGGI